MPRGPLPSANPRRRNAPTISTTELPAKGRTDPVPKCPYELAQAGTRWWKWAWKLPQATRWDDGSLYVVARRALLEDHAHDMAPSMWKEMRELDNRLGLNPKAMIDLRWSIKETAEPVKLATVQPLKAVRDAS